MASLRCLIIFSIAASTCLSSRLMRSSTSRCLTADRMRRIVASRSFSPARIAVFISSVMRSLSDIGLPDLPRGAHPVARNTLHMPLDRRGLLAFPLLGGLLVEFAPAQLGENSGLFAGALETP